MCHFKWKNHGKNKLCGRFAEGGFSGERFVNYGNNGSITIKTDKIARFRG
jgi:hypothetical protein